MFIRTAIALSAVTLITACASGPMMKPFDQTGLPAAVKAAGITPPALTIVGDVVGLQPRLAWFHPDE